MDESSSLKSRTVLEAKGLTVNERKGFVRQGRKPQVL
jgi:hypothetical protein